MMVQDGTLPSVQVMYKKSECIRIDLRCGHAEAAAKKAKVFELMLQAGE